MGCEVLSSGGSELWYSEDTQPRDVIFGVRLVRELRMGITRGRTKTGSIEFIPKLLTFPPPGTCLILTLEPHFDWTLLKSIFLSRTCTCKSKEI